MKQRPKPPKQMSFASLEFAHKKRVTRREKFLAEMERVNRTGFRGGLLA
jgi:IS5 family transposase